MNHTKYPPVKLTWQWTNTMSNKRIHLQIVLFPLLSYFTSFTRLSLNNFPMNSILAPRNLQEVHQSNQVHWDKVKFVSTAPRNTCPAPDVRSVFFGRIHKDPTGWTWKSPGFWGIRIQQTQWFTKFTIEFHLQKLNHQPRSTGLLPLFHGSGVNFTIPNCPLPPFISFHFLYQQCLIVWFDFFSHGNPNYPHNLTRNTKII